MARYRDPSESIGPIRQTDLRILCMVGKAVAPWNLMELNRFCKLTSIIILSAGLLCNFLAEWIACTRTCKSEKGEKLIKEFEIIKSQSNTTGI